jgi:hypothetical protein
MKIRTHAGATLALIAASVVILAIIGVAFFFIAQLMGGGHEVSQATDSGALNLAKQALKHPTVSSANTEFQYVTDPPGGPITLANYNRCVAHAMFVAANAQQMGTTQATQDAEAVYKQLTDIGRQLKDQLADGTQMRPYFDSLAQSNSTRMLGGMPIAQQNYQVAYDEPGQPTNVYFTASSFPQAVPGGLNSSDKTTVPQGSTGAYMSGYTPLKIGNLTFYGVPVYPKQQPHLISKSTFDSWTQPIDSNTPANAFLIGGTTAVNQTGRNLGASACSLVGALNDTGGGGAPPPPGAIASVPGATTSSDPGFIGQVNGGYIEIFNKQGAVCACVPADNSDNIFNNELYYEPGIDASQGSGGNRTGAFSTDTAQMEAWAAYNASTGSDPNGHNASLYPPSLGMDPSKIYLVKANWATGTPATLPADLPFLLQISGTENCLQELNEDELTGSCKRMLQSMELTYHPAPVGGSGGTSDPIFSAVDVAKAEVIDAFQKGDNKFKFDAGSVPKTGLGKYPNGSDKAYPCPMFPLPIQKTGTIKELLDQIGGSANTIKNELIQRCHEISPTVTDADVTKLLDTQLPMGTHLYISASGTGLTIGNSPPAAAKGASADGKTEIATKEYAVVDTLVDTRAGQYGFGDDSLHSQPFMKRKGGPLTGVDEVDWTSSSGFGGLLGHMEFTNSVQGSETFSKPN